MLLVPVVAIGAMVGAYLVLRGVGALLHRAVSAERLESLVRVNVREGLVGALVAVATVWSASRVRGVARQWAAVGAFFATTKNSLAYHRAEKLSRQFKHAFDGAVSRIDAF